MDTSLPIFEGTEQAWTIWSAKFQARAYMRGYEEHLSPNYKFTNEEEDPKRHRIEKDLHHKGYCDLICSMRKDQDTLLVSQTQKHLREA